MFKNIHTFRVKPKAELLQGISSYCTTGQVTSGIIIGIIGSLESAKLNFLMELPGRYVTREYKGPLEIVCAQGSIALKEDASLLVHIHAQLSEEEQSPGGHLAEAIVFSTAEVVIGELDYQLRRRLDSYTGLNELT